MNLELLNISEDFEAIKEIWTNSDFVNNSSYFLSWGWIENWLTSLPNDIPLQLAVVLEKAVPLVAFFIGKNKIVRKRIFKSRGFFLNTTGFKEYDTPLWIEYNYILCSDSSGVPFDDLILLLPNEWDELILPGLDDKSFPGNCLDQIDVPCLYQTNNLRVLIERDLPSFCVDLNLVREKNGDYVSLLSSNTRSQIRRSYRGYETKGAIELEEARSTDKAIEIFNEMLQIHQKTYKRMNKKSNFTTKYSETFHNSLIKNRFYEGEIQLLRITCGNEVIGCLYNFVYKGCVFFYQSGISYHADKRLKPGFICHSEAIRHNAALNHLCYDFLAGNERYKSSLATNSRRVIWARVQKRKLKFRLESGLERVLGFTGRCF